MKNIQLFILLTISLMTTSIWGQRVFEGNIIETKSSDRVILQETFKDQVLFTFNTASFNAFIKANAAFSNFQLNIGNELQWDINLEENELRSIDYKSIAMTDNGPVELDRTPCITFAGTIKGTAQQVRLNIESERVWGFIDSPNGLYYIEPLNRFVQNAEQDSYILYKTSQLVDKGHTCTASHIHSNHKKTEYKASNLGNIQRSAGDDCRKLEIATEADWQFFDDGNGNSDIIGNLNLVEAIYTSTFNMKFFIVFQNIWTTSSDPYTATGACSQGPYLNQFENEWTANFSNIRRDMSILYSGISWTGTTIGCAWTGVFGDDTDNNNLGQVYNVNEWLTSAANNTILVAHEMGHNFGASHNDTGNHIMNSTLGGNNQVFIASSQNEMVTDMDFVSTESNDGRSALRIRDFPTDSLSTNTIILTDFSANRSANEWHIDRPLQMNDLSTPSQYTFTATERTVLKPGFKAVIGETGNSLKLDIGTCNINEN